MRELRPIGGFQNTLDRWPAWHRMVSHSSCHVSGQWLLTCPACCSPARAAQTCLASPRHSTPQQARGGSHLADSKHKHVTSGAATCHQALRWGGWGQMTHFRVCPGSEALRPSPAKDLLIRISVCVEGDKARRERDLSRPVSPKTAILVPLPGTW